jgi:putative transcriptional regulator
LFEGGPVAKNQLFFLHTLGEKVPDAVPIQDNLWFGGDFNELLHIIDHEDVSENEVRFFVGYSGWENGQLEDEIAKGSWFVHETDPNTILTEGTAMLWTSELEKQKKTYKLFGEIGFDPSQN